MAVGFALVVFLCIEFVYGMSINNLEAAFFPAVSWGFLAFIAATIYQAKQAQSLENPPPEPYRLRFPETFATVQEVLNGCFDPPDGWKVIPGRHDKGEGDMQAYLIIKDDSFRNNRLLVPQRVLNKRLNLDVNVKPAGPGCTIVSLSYRVDCPWFANRADLNEVIRHTQAEVCGALDDLEVDKHG